MKPSPKVSVLMPVYNGVAYLREAIASILGQTFSDFEFLIIDDGSTDSSREIVQEFPDERIVFVCNDANLGLEATLNRGLQMAGGEFVARMDCDDVSHPSRLKKQVDFLLANPDVAACGTWLKTFGKCSSEWRFPETHEEIMARMIFQNSLPHAPVMLRKDILLANHLDYRTAFPGAEDYDLWARLMTRARLANLPEVLYHYRQYDSQVTRERADQKIDSANRVRKASLTSFGIAMSDEEFELHCGIALHRRDLSLQKVETWLLKIDRTNHSCHYFSERALRKVLGQYWFATCLRTAGSGLSIWNRYWESPLSAFAPLRFAERVKLYAKCALKR